MINYPVISLKIPLKIHFFLALLGVAGIGIILLATSNFGAGLTPDSIGYLSATRSLLAGKGILWYNGNPIDFWPPLYPVIIALGNKILGMDFIASSRVINALFFGMIIYLSGLLFQSLVMTPYLAILGTLYVLLANSLFSVSVMAWSEPTFILCVLLFILSIYDYLEKESRTSFVILTLSAMLACLTRYIGVTLILSGIASILILGRSSWRNKLIFSSVFASISAFPLGLWMLRNYRVGGTLAGYREPSQYTIFDHIHVTVEGIIRWFLPGRLVSFLRDHHLLVIMGIIFITLLTILLISYRSKIRVYKILPALFFTIIYLVFLIYTTTSIALDPIDNRFLSPVFVPMVLLGLLLIDFLAYFVNKKVNISSQLIGKFITIVLATLLVLPLSQTIVNVNYWRTQGGKDYNSKIWRQSQTIAYLKQHPLSKEDKTYSNDPYALYLYTELIAQKVHEQIKLEDSHKLSNFKRASSPAQKAYLIWFNDSHPGYFDIPDGFKSILNLSPVTQLDDGTIYILQEK